MQDRYRFRFWNKQLNRWFYFGFDTFHTYEKEIWEALTNGEKIYQCTGLKDVNGKLIYEGDIIKYMYYNPKRYTKWVVVFDQNTLEFGLKDYGYGGYLRITRNSILNNKVEIIGNKFQNPELLNEVENDNK